MSAALSGFFLSLTLILAIGAQNAFVLRQGLMRQHVFAVCLFCACWDAILITAGVAGFGALAQAVPWFETAMRYGGAAFLVWYGALNARSAWRGGAVMDLENGATQPLVPTVLTIAALSILNPHVYLDTLVLIGSISSQYENRLAFGIGATSASGVFFFSLGYGARLLTPFFQKPRSWQVLDVGIAVVMWAIAASLILG